MDTRLDHPVIRPSDPQKPRSHPLDGENAKDRVISRREKWILLWSTLGTFACFASFSSPEQALFRTFAIGAVVVVIRTKWDRRHDRRFWALLAALAVIHLMVLLLVRFPAPRFGMAAMPFFAADTFAMLGLVNWVERRFWRGGGAAAGGP